MFHVAVRLLLSSSSSSSSLLLLFPGGGGGGGGGDADDDDEGVDEVDTAAKEAARARRALAQSAMMMSEVLQAQLADVPDLAFAPTTAAAAGLVAGRGGTRKGVDAMAAAIAAASEMVPRWRKRQGRAGSARPLVKVPRRRTIRVDL